MNTRRAIRLAAPALFCAIGLVACAGSSADGRKGVTNLQPSSHSCLQLSSSCAVDDDCCSLWCANGECTRREP